MKRASIVDAKNNLSRYLEYVGRGGMVRIFNRATAVADLVPVGGASLAAAAPDAAQDERMNRLERQGIVRRGTGEMPKRLLKAPKGRRWGVLDALLEERRDGR